MEIELKSAKDIEALLLKLIKLGSSEDPDCIVSPDTIPKKDIKGFDSLTALEVLTEFEEETGLHFEEDIFFLDLKPKKFIPIRDIASTIWNRIQKGE